MEIKNLHDFIQFAGEGFTKRILFKTDNTVAFLLNFKPGHTLPPHKHRDGELFLHVLTGNLIIEVDGVSQEITTDQVVRCSGNEMLGIKNRSDQDATIYILLQTVCCDDQCNFKKDIR